MGITIHWDLRYSRKDPSRPLEAVRNWAIKSKLFKYVGEVQKLEGKDCDYRNYSYDHEDHWLLIQARDMISLLIPIEMCFVKLWWGDGCEQTNLCLAKYSIHQKNWRGNAFTKTHYAKDFITAHMAVCLALDFLHKQPSMAVKVRDDADFWKKRDVLGLIKTLDEWDEYLRGILKMIKIFSDSSMRIRGAVKEYLQE